MSDINWEERALLAEKQLRKVKLEIRDLVVECAAYARSNARVYASTMRDDLENIRASITAVMNG